MSIFLTIYFVFLLMYAALMTFAVYKVFLFAKNKDLKGHCRRITLGFMILVLSTILLSFFIIPHYQWNDDFSYYCKAVFPSSCSCGLSKQEQIKCKEEKDLEKKKEGGGGFQIFKFDNTINLP